MFSFSPSAGVAFAPKCSAACHHAIIGGYVLIVLAFAAIMWAVERRI